MINVQPSFKALIATIASGKTLTVDEAKTAFNVILSGDATPAQMGAFLMGLHMRGETVDELIGGVTVLREKATYITAPENAVDVVGTGGDGHGTLNISTAAAFITAGAGVPVARRPGWMDSVQQRVCVAVGGYRFDLQRVPRGRALAPQLLARAAPEPAVT